MRTRIVDLIVYYLSLCQIVTKVNYNIFQSQPFRMWRSHAATTKMNDCRNYTCIRKTQTNQSWGSAGGIKFAWSTSSKFILDCNIWAWRQRITPLITGSMSRLWSCTCDSCVKANRWWTLWFMCQANKVNMMHRRLSNGFPSQTVTLWHWGRRGKREIIHWRFN